MHLVCSPLSPRLCQPPQEWVRFSAWHRRGYSTAPAVAERWSVGGGVPSGSKPWGAGGNNPGDKNRFLRILGFRFDSASAECQG
jgi:hypothetical protein